MKLQIVFIIFMFLTVTISSCKTQIKSISKIKTKTKMYFLLQLIARVALKIIIRIATRGLLKRFIKYSSRKLLRRLRRNNRIYLANIKIHRLFRKQSNLYLKRAKRNYACKKASFHLSSYYKSYFHTSSNKIFHLLKALFQAGKCAYQIRNRKISRRLLKTFRKLKRSNRLRRIVRKYKIKHIRKLKRINNARSIRLIYRALKKSSRRINSEMKRLIRKSPKRALKIIRRKETIERGVKFMRRIISLADY